MANNVLVEVAENCVEPSWLSNVEPFVQKVLSFLKLDQWEMSVLFCRDTFIAKLNKNYRDIDSATDVLSFEAGDEYIDDQNITWYTAGDIVISLDTLKVNAQEFAVTENEELKRLLIHGILHLNGYDHTGIIDSDGTQQGSDEMLQLQEKILLEFSKENIIL